MDDLVAEYAGGRRIGLLKLDVEGAELGVLAHAGTWIHAVDAVAVELHETFLPGTERAFASAAHDFSIVEGRGEVT